MADFGLYPDAYESMMYSTPLISYKALSFLYNHFPTPRKTIATLSSYKDMLKRSVFDLSAKPSTSVHLDVSLNYPLIMSLPFRPRLSFPYPNQAPSWFAGHMSKSFLSLPTILKDIDLVIEARDARLPLTSINPAFDDALERSWGRWDTLAVGMGRRKERVVVYTKRDLAEQRFEEVSP